jgi:predicted nucleotidyltransferase
MSINSATDQIISDWRDLLSELETGHVRFLVIGGYAVMKYTEPYNTKDLDLWTDPAPENAGRLYYALARFGAPLKGITAEYFTVPGNFYQIGVSRWRVDIITSTAEDLPFETAWSRRADMVLAGMTVPVIGLDDLIVTKRAAGRPDDLIAIRKLEERQRRK